MNPDDVPDPDVIYRSCVESCERLGVEPPTLERVRQLVGEWNAIFAGNVEPPTKPH